MAKGASSVKKEYDKEFRKIVKRIEKLESEGYIFDERFLPRYRKKIDRAAIRHLKKFNEHYLKNLPSTKYRTRTGDITTGARGEEMQRSERAKKGARTRSWKRQWREMERIRINQGDALIQGLYDIIYDSKNEASFNRDESRLRRCETLLAVLNTEVHDNKNKLSITLSYYNESYLMELAQQAVGYTGKVLAMTAMNALLELTQIISGQVMSMETLQSIAGD